MSRKIVIITNYETVELIDAVALYGIKTLDIFTNYDKDDDYQVQALSNADMIITTEPLEVQDKLLSRYDKAKLFVPWFETIVHLKHDGKYLERSRLYNITEVISISQETQVIWSTNRY